jgi:glycosyltransferase involved in cell wall biosynthesis
MNKVSVISTVYNESENFNKAPPAILNQSYDQFEWIILDDNSTDDTVKKLHALSDRDPRVRILQSETRRGRAKCLNRVIEKAEGKYIAQQDFDDISFLSRLKLQKEFLDKNSQTGVVGGYYERIDKRRGEKYVRQVPTEHRDVIQALTKYIPFAHTIVMFRKEAWEDVGGYPIKQDIEDLELWIRMAANEWKLRNIPEVLGRHFVYGGSSWNNRFEYSRRQRILANTQREAIKKLDMPVWMHVYPIGRYFYPHLPDRLKRFIRQVIGQLNEKDI